MIVRLVQFLLICLTLAGMLLIYSLLSRLSEDILSGPVVVVLTVLTGVYGYGAVTFIAAKGVNFFAKPE